MKFRRESLVGISVALVFLFAVTLIGLRWLESAIAFRPVRYAAGAEWVVPSRAQDVWFETADGISLHGWFFDPDRKPANATIIYFHGNGGNITNVAWVGEDLSDRGFAVLLFDYRGYGRSEGKVIDEQGIYKDADAAYAFVTRQKGAGPLVLYGQSLGTAAVVDLASREPCSAIILESGLSSASDIASSVLPWFPQQLHFLLHNRFESAKKLRQVHRPVLITHGDPDPVIPTIHSQALFTAANEPKKLLIFPGAGHNVFGSVGPRYLDLVSQFIEDSLNQRR